LLRSYWMDFWNRRSHGSSRIFCQNIRAISSQQDMVEAFKYSTKLSVEHEEEVKAQDWIFQCTKGKRLAQPFGKLKRVKIEEREHHEEKVEEAEARTEIWFYEDDFKTYRSPGGECLASDEEVNEYKKERLAKKGRSMKKDISPNKAREHVIGVRVTFDTLDKLQRQARDENKPLSEYVNDLLLQH